MSAQVLGNARKGGVLKYAIEALRRLRNYGEVALLLSHRGDVILLPHWSPEYADALARKSAHLCGVYRMPADADAPAPVTAGEVCADMIERWRELRGKPFAIRECGMRRVA